MPRAAARNLSETYREPLAVRLAVFFKISGP